MYARDPFFLPCYKLNILAHGLRPKPFFLVLKNQKPIVYNINDKIDNLFTIKDINKNSYILVDNYGHEYIHSFA